MRQTGKAYQSNACLRDTILVMHSSSPLSQPNGRNQLPSPLDPFLAEFLAGIASSPNGYRHSTDKLELMRRFDWNDAFIDAIYTSAQKRRFFDLYTGGSGRGAPRLQLSKRAIQFLESRTIQQPDDG
jgi:hypothetical protein